MDEKPLSSIELERLRCYDTPTICNVIELFAIRPRSSGYMDRRIQACFPELPPMVGYAATATFRSSAPGRASIYASLEQQVAGFSQVPVPPVVVFQDLDDPYAAATFGEIMCTTYQAFGAAGLITSGAGRDLEQVRALDLPAFTNGTVCSHGYCHILSVHVAVQVGGVTLHPGDLLHGDRNGVTTIPLEIASEVADACEEFMRAEAVVLQYLRAGSPTVQGLAEANSTCAQIIERLRERVCLKQPKV
jgi:4-hydroxy-4-methyl-2-oxoglutarate aldolase